MQDDTVKVILTQIEYMIVLTGIRLHFHVIFSRKPRQFQQIEFLFPLYRVLALRENVFK